ncbi:RibD family protein [Phenylobacterium parvum]|uniref:Deaminase n=1 Tax=Phenylobacterium parvum TaxID=2201350 RepID=A0A2Z3I0W4_9CAUL|nr:RibD family protein [Phenylobacterium parvum]AWM77398.1 deaminase [Phenylobacterium parvum]
MTASRITLKLATSLDGRIATATGESRWITGEESRLEVHQLRAEAQAVIVGIETALADDPELTVRLDGFPGPQPARVVLDTHQRLPPRSRLAVTAREIPTYVIASGPADPALQALGVRILSTGTPGVRPDPARVVEVLAAEGLSRLFLEGGGQVAAAFMAAGLVDRLVWFRAPLILGARGRPAVGDLPWDRLADAPRFRRAALAEFGPDLCETYERT